MIRLSLNQLSNQAIIARVIEVLGNGGLVIYPTETTYGLGADATNPQAIQKLLDYKTKRSGKALSIMAADQTMAEEYVELNDTARSIYDKFLPGPVTVVSVGRHRVAPEVESSAGTLGIRISSYKLVREIAAALGRPFTATSANPSGEKRPYSVEDILERCSQRQRELLDLIIDADELPPNEPSTVIDTTLDTYRVLRQGRVEFAQTTKLNSHSETETQALGYELARKYRNDYGHRPVIFALEGEMGTGKTQFTKGLAAGLGVVDLVKSPSYTLVHEYVFQAEGKNLPLIHIDAWRLEKADELQQLGFSDFISRKAVVALEWADSEVDFLQQFQEEARIIWIKFTYGGSVDEREISWSDRPKFV